MKFLLIISVFISSVFMLKAQSDNESFYYKIKEYYSQSIHNEPNYYEQIPVIDSIHLKGKNLSDSLFHRNRLELVNILLKPIPKITLMVNDSLEEYKKDSINEIIQFQQEKISDLISEKESAAYNLIRNMNDIIHLNRLNEQLVDILYNEIYKDSILVGPDLICILSFLKLNEDQKKVILEDSRSNIYCKAFLGDKESIHIISNQFLELINEEYSSNISNLLKLTSWIIIIDNIDLNKEFLNALQNDKIIYNEPDEQGNLKAYSLSYLMITAYNTVYYNKLDYFMRYVSNNPNLVRAMEPYYYYKAISLYFQDTYNLPVNIKARRFLFDTNLKYLK